MYFQRLNQVFPGYGGVRSVFFILFAVLLSVGTVFSAGIPQTRLGLEVSPPLAAKAFELPLAFIPNQGQSAPKVRFQAQARGGSLFFTQEGVVLSLPVSKASAAVLGLRFEGANASPAVEAQTQLPGVVNYLLGNNPDKWRTNLPAYAGILYRQLYPGIDLAYTGKQGSLKGTYHLSAGADPSLIRWRYTGASSLAVDEAGNLQIGIAANKETTVTETAPVAWQMLDGQRVTVEAGYFLHEDGSAGFALGGYDQGEPLIIDPDFVFSTYFGGNGADSGVALTVGSHGSIYVAGETWSTAFPETEPGYGSLLSQNVFVSKLSPAGDAIVYSTLIGGSGSDYMRLADITGGIAVDQAGHATVSGYTSSTDFPVINAFQPTFGGSSSAPYFGDDSFVLKLAPDGASLIYSSYIGGSGFDNAAGVGVDSAGNAYVAGQTNSPNFPMLSPLQPAFAGGFNDAFVIKISPAGGLMFSTYFGGAASEFVNGATADAGGKVYFTGRASSSGLATPGAFQTSIAGNYDAFVARMNPATPQLEYFSYLGGYAGDVGGGVAVDQEGKMYVTGVTYSNDFPLQNALQSTLQGTCGTSPCSDAFVSKLTSDGSALVYSTFLGGSDHENFYPNGGLGAIAADDQGNAYVTGYTESFDFPVHDALQESMDESDFQNAFVSKIEPDGSAFVYSSYLGGTGDDSGYGIAAGPLGDTYVIGGTDSADFPTQNALQGTLYNSFSDAFVVRITDAMIIEGVDVFVNTPASLNVSPGAQVGVPITVGNQGLTTASDVVLVATLPADVSYLGDSSGITPTINGNEVSWEFGTLSFGQGASFTLQLSFPDIQPGENRAVALEINSNESDEVTSNNAQTVTLISSRNIYLPIALR